MALKKYAVNLQPVPDIERKESGPGVLIFPSGDGTKIPRLHGGIIYYAFEDSIEGVSGRKPDMSATRSAGGYNLLLRG